VRRQARTSNQERTSNRERTSNQERTSKKDQQRAASADGTKGNQESLPVAEYDDLTVEEAKKRLSGLSEDELKKIRSHEKKHKQRNTLLTWLDHEINKGH
jgi:hypothetical protein